MRWGIPILAVAYLAGAAPSWALAFATAGDANIAAGLLNLAGVLVSTAIAGWYLVFGGRYQTGRVLLVAAAGVTLVHACAGTCLAVARAELWVFVFALVLLAVEVPAALAGAALGAHLGERRSRVGMGKPKGRGSGD